MRFLITGTSGFIGFHLARRLLNDGHEVQGVDGMTPYYDVELKKARQRLLVQSNRFTAHTQMLEDEARLAAVYAATKPDIVVHLAAQAGVRYSLGNPRAYVDSNVVGTFNLLELMRAAPPRHFLYASTSSVYGANEAMPFRETDEPFSIRTAPPTLGEHNREILGGLLGLSDAEIDQLAREGIIGTEMLMEEQLVKEKKRAAG